MKYDMKKWLLGLPKSKRPLPLLSFPATQLIGVSVYEFTHDSQLQAQGIAQIANKTNSAAAICMMDLSVEAEAFGCQIQETNNEVPTVVGVLISDEDEAAALEVPEVGVARTGMYIDAARKAKELITDRPVLAGIIGPFSLAGRLMDVSEALVNCIADEDFVHAALRKTTSFLKKYALTYKEAGVDGLIMAEPLAGLLSPGLESQFSAPYVRDIINSVQDDNFIVIYHNCGPNTPFMTESLYGNGADGYHFGDVINMENILEKMPNDKPIFGNISPSEYFVQGNHDTMYKKTTALLEGCSKYDNFVLSSGCDIPPGAKWENITAFFDAAQGFARTE